MAARRVDKASERPQDNSQKSNESTPSCVFLCGAVFFPWSCVCVFVHLFVLLFCLQCAGHCGCHVRPVQERSETAVRSFPSARMMRCSVCLDFTSSASCLLPDLLLQQLLALCQLGHQLWCNVRRTEKLRDSGVAAKLH